MQPRRRPELRPEGRFALGVGELARAVSTGQVSALEVTQAHLERIAAVDAELNAMVRVDTERALRAARAIDRRRSRGSVPGPLAGVPFVVKDNVDVRRQSTTSGSRAAAAVVALRDAPVVARLRAAGAILLGRANMDEFAMGASTRTSAYGRTGNPWDLTRSPGGSSGGSAAAVAAGLAPFSVGTDTGGSIREPAAQCGVVGVAPSPGLVPLAGVMPFAPELDRVGPLARCAADAALVLRVMAGRTTRSLQVAPPRRVGVVPELCSAVNAADVLDCFAAAVERLRDLGVEVVEVPLPDGPRALAAYMTLTSVACLPYVEPFVATGLAGEETRRRCELGRELRGSAALTEAEGVAVRLRAQIASALTECPVLLSPTMPSTAPTWDSITGRDLIDPMRAPYTDCWTVVANLTGLPAVSVPIGTSAVDGMPVGAMLMGTPGADADLLALAGEIADQALMSTLSA